MKLHMESLQARANAAPAPGPVWTLGAWVEHWLDHYGPTRCQPKTLQRYRELFRYISEDLRQVPLVKVNHTAIEAALIALLKAPAKRRAHLSPRTIHNIAGPLSVALNKAFRLDLITVSPALRVELPPLERQDARSLNTDEIHCAKPAKETGRLLWSSSL